MAGKQYPDSKTAKAAGWFSSRHQTSLEHGRAKMGYLEVHGPDARSRKAGERNAGGAGRTPQEQIAILDSRLGPDQGAKRERVRLRRLADLKGKLDSVKDLARAERDIANTEHTAGKEARALAGILQHAEQELETMGRQGLRADHTCGDGGSVLDCPACQMDLEAASQHS